MPYIGNELATQFQAFTTQTITGDGSTGYTLDKAVANGKELLVYINNVKQEEGSGKSYTATGTTITFSEAVASTDTCYVVYLGSAIQTVVPPDASVTSAKLDTNIAVSGNLDVGTIRATNGTTAMTINSSGLILPRIPILQVAATDTDQSASTASGDVKVQWETVELDTISGWSTSNNNYTPNVKGYYLVGGMLRLGLTANVHSFYAISIRKNNTKLLYHQTNLNSDLLLNGIYPLPTGLIQMNGSSDFLDVVVSSDEDMVIHQNDNKSLFFAQLVHAT